METFKLIKQITNPQMGSKFPDKLIVELSGGHQLFVGSVGEWPAPCRVEARLSAIARAALTCPMVKLPAARACIAAAGGAGKVSGAGLSIEISLVPPLRAPNGKMLYIREGQPPRYITSAFLPGTMQS